MAELLKKYGYLYSFNIPPNITLNQLKILSIITVCVTTLMTIN